MERFFLDTDNSDHWYLVPAQRRREWEDWLDLDEDDSAGWDAPEWAERIDGNPSDITFALPEQH